MTGLRCCSAFMTCCCVARRASKSAPLPSGRECSRTSANGGVCVRHCSTLFMKQVLPRFCSPAPCAAGLPISSHTMTCTLPQDAAAAAAAAQQACAQQHLCHKPHVHCAFRFAIHELCGLSRDPIHKASTGSQGTCPSMDLPMMTCSCHVQEADTHSLAHGAPLKLDIFFLEQLPPPVPRAR